MCRTSQKVAFRPGVPNQTAYQQQYAIPPWDPLREPRRPGARSRSQSPMALALRSASAWLGRRDHFGAQEPAASAVRSD